MSGITKVSKFVLGDNSVSLSKLDATGAAVGKVLAVGIGNTLQFEDKLVTEDVEDIVAGLILRGNHTNLSVSYIDGTNQLDLAVSGLATVSTSGSYNDLTDTPTNVSVFINDAGYLTSYTETDPVFTASPSAGITTQKINDWDTAFSWGNHATQTYATETYVDTEISNLVASAPATLDTLNELAAALGDDPNFATTIATNISTKVSKSGDTMTGDLTVPNIIVSGNVDGRDVSADGTKLDGIEVNAKDDQTITAGSGLIGGGTGDVTLSHADTSTIADVNGSGSTFIQDIGFDTYGHVISVGTGTVTLGDGTMTVTAGPGLTGGGQLGTANQSGPSSISLSVTDAPKWSTARTLSLSGDASGSVSWDGSANATLNVTVADDSHTHDGRYYTESEADSRFVNVTGDTMTGDLLIDSTDAEINLKAGVTGTSAALNWTFNTTDTNYASIKLPYDTRASTGLHIDSGYPITIDATTRIDFDISGTTYASLDTSGLSVGANTVFHDGYHPNADKWTTSRTLSLSGDASGSVSWDGSGNATLSVDVGNANSVDGYSVSTTRDSANTIPVRDASGYLQLGWINTTSGATTNTITKIYGTYSGDNYIRYFTPATLISQQGIWTSGNDGSGSGLDADTLDGLHASEIGGGSTNFGDVGTYAFLRYTPNYASISPNTNYAGSSLQYTSIHRSAGNNILMPTNGGSPSGTWRSMGGGTNNVFGGTNWPATLFVRIS